MPTDQYIDMKAHEKLMSKMQEVVDKAGQLIDESQTAREQISDHNLDATAHPDLRRAIEEMDAASNSSVTEAIQQHNESSSAHLALFAEIEEKIKDMSNTTALIQEAVAEHNSSEQAHSDIRESINKINTQLGSNNMNDVVNRIEEIENTIGMNQSSTGDSITNINQQIADLQSVDSRHDSEINALQDDVENIYSILDNTLERDVVYLGNRGAAYEEEADTCHLISESQRISQELGYTLFTSGGPSFLNYECTLPMYVGRGSTKEFSITGVTSPNGAVTYDITPGQGPISFSKTKNIALGEKITVQVEDTAPYHSLCYFTVTAKDVTGNTTQKVVAFYVTTPIDPDNVTLSGLPDGVEPGNKYEFFIRNLVESGKRYSYDINRLSSGLLFTLTNDLDENVKVTMTVPSAAVRGSRLNFELVIHDIYNGDVIKSIWLDVNRLPGTENFSSTLPKVIAPNTSVNIKFSGITSIDGTAATYRIENKSKFLTFGKKDGILANENVLLTLAKNATRGEFIQFDVVSVDKNKVELTIPCGFTVNHLPDSSTVACNMPTETQGGRSINMTITNGTDLDDDTVTYEIKDVNSGFTFSRTTNISEGQSITVTVPKVASDTVAEFEIYVVDSLGEKSTPYRMKVTVKPIFIQVAPQITYPTNGSSVQAEFTARITPYSDYADV